MLSNVQRRSTSDIGRQLIKAARNVLGIVSADGSVAAAGTVASLLGDYWPNCKIERIRTFVDELEFRLKDVERKLDDDSFCFLVERAMRTVASDHRDFKRIILANVIVDAVGTGPASISISRLFLELTDAIEPYHAEILHRLMAIPFDEPTHPETGMRYLKFESICTAVRLDGSESDGLRSDVALSAVNFLGGQGLLVGPPGDKRAVMRPTNALAMWKGRYALSDLGKCFVKYLLKN